MLNLRERLVHVEQEARSALEAGGPADASQAPDCADAVVDCHATAETTETSTSANSSGARRSSNSTRRDDTVDCEADTAPDADTDTESTCSEASSASAESEDHNSSRVVIPADYTEGDDWARGAVLGTGACGTVFEAIDLNSGTMMAMKEVCGGPS